MRLLHTADTHTGRLMPRTQASRAAEHRQVWADLAHIAADYHVDATLVAGDLFEHANPAADAEEIVYTGLEQLGRVAPVVVSAGNHDNHQRLRAVANLLGRVDVRVAARVARPDDGGVLRLDTPGGSANIAALPFVSQRRVVRAADLMQLDRDGRDAAYADRIRKLLQALAGGFTTDGVNLVMAHLTCASEAGLLLGGGERAGHTTIDYTVPPSVFPPQADYIALGHIHHAQEITGGPTTIRYPGSPLHLDFGDTPHAKQALVVDVEPGQPPQITPVEMTAGRPFITLTGSPDDVVAAAGQQPDDAVLRLLVDSPPDPGVQAELAEAVPHAVRISLTGDHHDDDGDTPAWEHGDDISDPAALFADYVARQGVTDERVTAKFRELHEQLAPAGDAAAPEEEGGETVEGDPEAVEKGAA